MSQSATGVPPPATGLTSSVKLSFEGCGGFTTRLAERYRTGHFHIGKPYCDGRQMTVQVVNSTAGIFENDQLECDFHAGPGARACVLSPSSSQVYTMPSGLSASSVQRIRVRAGAALSVIPRWLVPHRDSRFSQATEVQLETGAGLLLAEPLSMGRISFGEYLEFSSLSSSVEISINGKLLLRDRFLIGKDRNPWLMQRPDHKFAYFCALYISFPEAAVVLGERLPACPSFPARARTNGYTALSDDLVVVRLVAESCIEISSTLTRLFRLLANWVPVSPVLQRMY